jgi:hypothetical protein
MLVVVNLHRPRVDMRLQRIERVREWGNSKWHAKSSAYADVTLTVKDSAQRP